MLKRRWIYRIALGFTVAISLLVAGYGYGKYRLYKAQHAYEREKAAEYQTYQARQQQPVAEDFSPPVLSDRVEPEQRDYATYYDLKAQQDMAEWTYSMLWVGIIGLIASAVGIGFVYENLREMRRQSALAESASIETRRAWLFFWAYETGTWRFSEKDRSIEINLEIGFENHGLQPSINTRFYVDVAGSEGAPEPFRDEVVRDRIKQYQDEDKTGLTIFPGKMKFDPHPESIGLWMDDDAYEAGLSLIVTVLYQVIGTPEKIGITTRHYRATLFRDNFTFRIEPRGRGSYAE